MRGHRAGHTWVVGMGCGRLPEGDAHMPFSSSLTASTVQHPVYEPHSRDDPITQAAPTSPGAY
jgi:hypothetical protein